MSGTSTVVVSVASSLVSGGVIGGVVSLIVSKRESRDRGAALALEREKWEHEKNAEARHDAKQTCRDVIAHLEDVLTQVAGVNGYPPTSVQFATAFQALYANSGAIAQRSMSLLFSIKAFEGLIAAERSRSLVSLLSEAHNAFNVYMNEAEQRQIGDLTFGRFYGATISAVAGFKGALGYIK